eukprot:6240123-Amphidinium_carterae.1
MEHPAARYSAKAPWWRSLRSNFFESRQKHALFTHDMCFAAGDLISGAFAWQWANIKLKNVKRQTNSGSRLSLWPFGAISNVPLI